MSILAIGGALRRIRSNLGLTQAEVAKLTNASAATISRWETGAAVPREEALAQYLAALEATPSDFSSAYIHAICAERADLGKPQLLRLEYFFLGRIEELRFLMQENRSRFPSALFDLLNEQLKHKEATVALLREWLDRMGMVIRGVSSFPESEHSTMEQQPTEDRDMTKGQIEKLVSAQVTELAKVLTDKITKQDFTQEQVQRKLGWGRTYISQLRTGQKSLRVNQILKILLVIGIEPREFCAEIFPEPQVKRGLQ